MPKWITPPEYAAKYGISRFTVNVWVRKNKLQAIRRGSQYLVLDPEVMEIANPSSREIHKEDFFPLLRGQEAAKLAGISPRRLRDYCELGYVKPSQIGRSRRYSIQNIRDIIAYRTTNKRKPLKAEEKRALVLSWAKGRLTLKP